MKAKRQRMGDVLVELGLVDEHRLNHALDVSVREGLRLGEALIFLGYLSEDQVLGVLKNLTGVPVLDMLTNMVSLEAQTLLPPDKMREWMTIPLSIENESVRVAFADPLNYFSVENVKLQLNRDIIPVLASRSQIEDTLDALEKAGLGKQDFYLQDVKRNTPIAGLLDSSPLNILRLLNEENYSNLHLSVGAPPAIRTGGVFTRYNMPILTSETMNRLIHEILSDEQKIMLKQMKEVELTYLRPGVGRYRINIYSERDGEFAISARRLIEDVPSYDRLGIPEEVISLLDKTGLLLVASPGGQGKGGTIASLIDHINSTRACNIITFEDPIEYIHMHKMSNVNQRELGRDTIKDTQDLYENVFKHDPDILVFSDLKDIYMANTAIRATQKGILVIAGINAIDVFSAVDQIGSILSNEYMKTLFANSLLAVFAQRILVEKSKKSSALIWEMLVGKPRIQKYLRDNKVFFIKGQASSLQGEYYPMEESLAQAIKAGKIDRRIAELEPNINREMLATYLDRIKQDAI